LGRFPQPGFCLHVNNIDSFNFFWFHAASFDRSKFVSVEGEKFSHCGMAAAGHEDPATWMESRQSYRRPQGIEVCCSVTQN
jgi:hypothetical protein